MEWTGGAEGMRDPLSDCTCPLDFLLLFWPVDILQTIVQMTNLYAMEAYAVATDGIVLPSPSCFHFLVS